MKLTDLFKFLSKEKTNPSTETPYIEPVAVDCTDVINEMWKAKNLNDTIRKEICDKHDSFNESLGLNTSKEIKSKRKK